MEFHSSHAALERAKQGLLRYLDGKIDRKSDTLATAQIKA